MTDKKKKKCCCNEKRHLLVRKKLLVIESTYENPVFNNSEDVHLLIVTVSPSVFIV